MSLSFYTATLFVFVNVEAEFLRDLQADLARKAECGFLDYGV